MMTKISVGLIVLTTSFACSTSTGNNNTGTTSALNQQAMDTTAPTTEQRFKEPDNTAVFTTKFVITDHKEITEVHHDEDGDWQFFSEDAFDDLSKVAKLVGLGQLTTMDSTLFEIANLPKGHVARRKHKRDPWNVEKEK